MRTPPVTPMDSTRSTDRKRESFACRVNAGVVPRTAARAPEARWGWGRKRSTFECSGPAELQQESADDVGLRLFGRLLAEEKRLLHGAFRFVAFAVAGKRVGEPDPARCVLLVERTSFAKGDAGAPMLAFAAQPERTGRQLDGALGDVDVGGPGANGSAHRNSRYGNVQR